MRMPTNAPELIDDVDRREAVFLAFSVQDGTESPIMIWDNSLNEIVPLVTTKERMLPEMLAAAELVSETYGTVVRVARFTAREDLAIYGKDGRWDGIKTSGEPT